MLSVLGCERVTYCTSVAWRVSGGHSTTTVLFRVLFRVRAFPYIQYTSSRGVYAAKPPGALCAELRALPAHLKKWLLGAWCSAPSATRPSRLADRAG